MKIDSIKSYIFIATTAIGLFLYFQETYATNKRVEKIEQKQSNQQKVGCLIALKINVNKNDLRDICNLKIKN